MTLGAVARSSLVNDSDATSWRPHGDRPWLWVMAQPLGAYFQSPLPRSPRAFALLIAAWLGLRVREGYSVSQHWQGLGQHCFAPLIRTAKGLAAHRDAGLARCGGRRPGEWQRLGHRGLERPTGGHGRAWYARFRSLGTHHGARVDKAGTVARRWERAGESLGVFLDSQGVAATTNMAERAPPLRGVVAPAESRDREREGQWRGGAGPVAVSSLSSPGAPDVPDSGRRGVRPVQRGDACSALDSPSRVPTGVLHPVISYSCSSDQLMDCSPLARVNPGLSGSSDPML